MDPGVSGILEILGVGSSAFPDSPVRQVPGGLFDRLPDVTCEVSEAGVDRVELLLVVRESRPADPDNELAVGADEATVRPLVSRG